MKKVELNFGLNVDTVVSLTNHLYLSLTWILDFMSVRLAQISGFPPSFASTIFLSEKEPLMDANETLVAADEPGPGFHERSISADQRFLSFALLRRFSSARRNR